MMSDMTPLHVTVFGATGKIGRLVVDQLLDAGHIVTAYVRTPEKLTTNHRHLRVVVGDLRDAGAIAGAVAGADGVISALGPSLRRSVRGTPVGDGTQLIVAAMREHGVRRFVGLATPSVVDPRDRPTLKAKVIPKMAKAMFPNALADLLAMTEAVTSSDLVWTIARITNPTSRSAKRSTRAGFLGVDKVGSSMTRADIAAFLVGQLTDVTYERAMPAISN